MASTPDSKNTSFKTQQFEISFLKSNRGKPLLIYKNYLFRWNKKTAVKKYRMCLVPECGVYIHTTVTEELISISHDHDHSAYKIYQ